MFRSEQMLYYSIIFSKENAIQVLNEIGNLGIIDVEDWYLEKNEIDRPFNRQVQENKNILVLLQELENILLEEKFSIVSPHLNEEDLSDIHTQICNQVNNDHIHHFNDLSEEIQNIYTQVIDQKNELRKIEDQLKNNCDHLNLLQQLKEWLPNNFDMHNTSFQKNEFFKNQTSLQLKYFIGVIETKNLYAFQKQIFRMTKGNVFSSYQNLKNPYIQDNNIKIEEKTALLITFHEGEDAYLENKLKQVGGINNITNFDIPDNYKKLMEQEEKLRKENIELNLLFQKTSSHYKEYLNKLQYPKNFSNLSYLKENQLKFMRNSYLLETHNKFYSTGSIMEGRIWFPSNQKTIFFENLKKLETLKEFNGFKITVLNFDTFNKIPPTQIQTNQFSDVFQEIVDTYSIPKYQEVNPGLFTIVTFPFLFGVMFGDIGHGLGLMVIGIFMFLKRHTNNFFMRLYGMIIFMGFFAFFCGLIYNDFLAVPFPLQHSCYQEENHKVSKIPNCTYNIGIDYIWHHSENGIGFINSFKMKLSIIIGVIHMLIGILMKGLNTLYFRQFSGFLFEFIPQFVFMLATFGYMVFCIVFKWFQDYSQNTDQAPSIISLFINFTTVDKGSLYDQTTQQKVQNILGITSLICVPLMMLGKPIALSFNKKQKENQHKYVKLNDSQTDSNIIEESQQESFNSKQSIIEQKKEEHGDDEVFIHQMIETIEFVLGSISNTASYLRLWALSLAHSQLAKVFYEMIMKQYLMGEKSIFFASLGIVISFVFFFIVNFAVIMVMDFMECFLHALRLHWVEFQNKFYQGNGIRFEKFDLKINLETQINQQCQLKLNMLWYYVLKLVKIFQLSKF